MKKRIVGFLLLIPFFFAQDTTIRGVAVKFYYNQDIFPESWRTAPINAKGEEIASTEIQRSKKIMIRALTKYPRQTLEQNLNGGVYWLKSLKFFDVGYGGTNSNDALYLTDNGEPMGYTNFYMEETFHHEFSSILMRNYPAFLDTLAWKNANEKSFNYNDPENGVGAIRNNQSSQELDTMICKKGMLTQYGMSSLENDANTFAQNLFCPTTNFWAIVDHFTMIHKKTILLIGFYHQLSSVFTEDYFRKLASNN
jgi:hypothetical protein